LISSSFIIAYFYDISAKLRFLFGSCKEIFSYFSFFTFGRILFIFLGKERLKRQKIAK